MSKNFQKFISKLLEIKNIIINRRDYFKKNVNFHQTNIMFQLVNKTIAIKNPKNFVFLPKHYLYEKKIEKRIILHLSSKWINQKYNENKFLELISKLEKNSKLFLTTDQSSTFSLKRH